MNPHSSRLGNITRQSNLGSSTPQMPFSSPGGGVPHRTGLQIPRQTNNTTHGNLTPGFLNENTSDAQKLAMQQRDRGNPNFTAPLANTGRNSSNQLAPHRGLHTSSANNTPGFMNVMLSSPQYPIVAAPPRTPGIIGIGDENYSIDKSTLRLQPKQIVRVDSDSFGAKGLGTVQESVKKQYEENIPQAIVTTQNELDDVKNQLDNGTEYLTTQIEKLQSIKAEKIVPTLLTQLALIYKVPLPELDDDNQDNSATDYNEDVVKDTCTKMTTMIEQLNQQSDPNNDSVLVHLNKYACDLDHKAIDVTSKNLDNIVKSLISVSFDQFEPNAEELAELKRTWCQEQGKPN